MGAEEAMSPDCTPTTAKVTYSRSAEQPDVHATNLTQGLTSETLPCVIAPPPLSPGCAVQVIAPSSPFDHTLVLRALGWLATHHPPHFAEVLHRRTGFLAGTDEQRARELQSAFDEPSTGAIVIARGGHGLVRLLDSLDWTAMLLRPKWIVGFSDVTALHLEAQSRGLASLHAQHLTTLGRGDHASRSQWLDALHHPLKSRKFDRLSTLASGQATGTLVGGNLTMVFTMAAAGRLRLPPNSILLLEDVSETSYRIDRMLAALRLSGLWDRLAGVVLGTFSDCSPGRFNVPVQEVLADHFSRLSIPVLQTLPVGHDLPNVPIPLGFIATLDARSGTMLLDPPTC
jgi:muramoyltetrapeptide carboxypeptidase